MPRQTSQKPVLMSLNQQWADAILDGTKTVELRRVNRGCQPGCTVVVYASYPVKQVQGLFEVAEVITAAPDELWELTKGRNGCTREEFDAYLDGCDQAAGIVVTGARRIPEPFALGFNGPMSTQFLDASRSEHRSVLRRLGL